MRRNRQTAVGQQQHAAHDPHQTEENQYTLHTYIIQNVYSQVTCIIQNLCSYLFNDENGQSALGTIKCLHRY